MNLRILPFIYIWVISICTVVMCEHDEALLQSSPPQFDTQIHFQTGYKMYDDFQNY